MRPTELVLANDCLTATAQAQDNIARVAAANRIFDLGLDKTGLSRARTVNALMGWFASDVFLGLRFFCDLLYDMEENGGLPVDAEARTEARQLRALGWAGMAELIDDYFDLVSHTPREVARPLNEDDTVSGSPDVEAALEGLRARWRHAVGEALKIDVNSIYSEIHGYHFVPDEALHRVFADRLDITMVSQQDFEKHWLQRIQMSPLFQRTSEVQKRLGRDLAGALTDRMIASLSAKGYHLEFTFWQQSLPIEESEVGARTRGYIYVQTSRGPIRLHDRTDEASMRTHYPVTVKEMNGVRRFVIGRSSDMGRQKSSWVAAMLRGFAGQN